MYTDLPILGTFNPLAKTQDSAAAPPWAVYNQMKEFFEVKRIHEKTKSIPEGLELLMLVHPKRIPERLLYAIDQFVLKGENFLFLLTLILKQKIFLLILTKRKQKLIIVLI